MLLLVTASAAQGATLTPSSSGAAVVTLTRSAEAGLGSAGIRFAALAPATTNGRGRSLPVRSGYVGSYAVLQTDGSLRLRAVRGGRTRTAKLSALQFKLGRHPTVSALIGSTRLTIFKLAPAAGTLKLDTGARSVRLTSGAPLTLTATAASTLARILKVRTLTRRTFAMVRLQATLAATPPGQGTPASPANPGSPTVPTTPGTPPGTPAVVPACPLAPGGSAVDPGPATPPVPARPSGAVDITAATITWNVRESFIQYINSGEGTSVSGGAVAAPPRVAPGNSASLVYSFSFPFAHGWCDAASGGAAIYGGGAVRFLYSAHGIDLLAATPEVELTGTAARVVFTLTSSGEPRRPPGRSW